MRAFRRRSGPAGTPQLPRPGFPAGVGQRERRALDGLGGGGAATGLAIVMVLAAATHIRRREPSGVAVNAVLFALAAFVAWGRFGPYAL